MTYVAPPRARRGMPITARRMNLLEEGVRGNQLVSGAGVAVSRGVNATTIAGLDDGRRVWVRITTIGTGATAGRYGWQMIRGFPGGGWADRPGAGTSGTTTVRPLFEANGVATLAAGTRVEMAREPASGEWRVQLDLCP